MTRKAILRIALIWVIGVFSISIAVVPVSGADSGPAPAGTLGQTDIVLVIDNSGSMKKNDPDFLTRGVVARFMDALGANTRIGMVFFDRTVRLAEPLSDLTELQHRARFLESLDTIDYRGQLSDSPAAMERAIYEVKTNGRKDAEKVVILLTDGIVDTGGKATDIEKTRWLKDELALEAGHAGITIFGIAFTDKADFSLIQTIAIRTGGDYFRAFTIDDIPGVFNQILESINPSARQPVAKKAGSEAPTAKPPLFSDAPAAVTPNSGTAEDAVSMKETPVSKTPSAITPKTQPQNTDPGVNASVIVIGCLVLAAVIVMIRIRKGALSNAAATDAGRGGAPHRDDIAPAMAELVDLQNITGTARRPLDRRQMRIGRDESNDIVIPDNTISSLHAVIQFRDGFFYLEDRGSKNKTRLNGVDIGPQGPVKLNSGDEIILNRLKFRFHQPDMLPPGHTAMAFGNGDDTSASVGSRKKPPAAPQSEPEGMPLAILIDVGNITGKKTITLDRRILKIGRGVQNDIVIAQKSISGSHATIEHRNGDFFLEDQRSKNQTWLNGEKITPHTPEKLKSGDEIAFDTYAFIFMLEHQMPAGETDNHGP